MRDGDGRMTSEARMPTYQFMPSGVRDVRQLDGLRALLGAHSHA
jgi:hypothetical protein